MPKLRTLPLSCRVFIRMPKAATAPTPSRSVSLCSAPFLPCPPSLGASHLPFPSAPSFTPSPVADPAACLPIFTLVFGGLCVFGRRGRPQLFSLQICLPTCYRASRPQPDAGHACVPPSQRVTVPSQRQQAHLPLLPFGISFKTFVPQAPVRWRLEVTAGHPRSCTDPGTTQWCLDRPP